MWYWLTDHTQYVYHYTRARTLAEKILPAGRLRFSPFREVNDPREFKDWTFSYHPAGDFYEPALKADLNDRIKHGWRIGCFCTDVPEGCGPTGHFERGHYRPRMWAQYGENHEGACLVFEREQLDRDIKQAAAGRDVRSGYVSYEIGQVVQPLGKSDHLTIMLHDVNRLGVAGYARHHIERHWKRLFFTKERDWEHEREYRWMVAGADTDYLYIDVSKSLVGVLLGHKFPESYHSMVRNYALTNSVNIAKMEWNNEGIPQPRLVPAELLHNPPQAPAPSLGKTILVILAVVVAVLLYV